MPKHKTGRPPKGTQHILKPNQKAFLEAYAQLGNIAMASKAAGVAASCHRSDWCNNPTYMAAFLEAQEQANDMLEAEAIRRATRGTDKPVFHKGKQCGTIREYSDSLLAMLLKATRPGKFRENVNHSGDLTTTIKMYGKEAPTDRV